ncbi:hypothetical protein RND81_14G178500 [Saponaria officinalis]|uniref:Uncharacterized protein n=1 Tax=Saponaria officinalis TaxID=3572 RepID=A0AAW1GV52_SAPOF
MHRVSFKCFWRALRYNCKFAPVLKSRKCFYDRKRKWRNLNGLLNVTKHVLDTKDMDVMEMINDMIKNLREKHESLEYVESLNQTLIVKERMSNEELHEARKELINGLKDMSNRGDIGVKRMGELDTTAFQEACRRR